MKRIKSTILLFCLFLVCTGSFAEKIKLLRGNSYEMSVTQPEIFLNIPVELPVGTKIEGFRIDVFDVKFNNKADNAILPKFETSLERDTILRKIFIRLTVTNGAVLRPGLYNLTIREKNSKTSVEDTNKINLTISPAAIRIPATVNATIVENIFGNNKIFPSSLSIYETTGNSYVKSIVIQKNGDFIDPKGLPFQEKIEFKNLEKGVSAGEQVGFEYSIEGDFDIGKTSGNFEIISPQLSAPVPFKMEISYKKGVSWLILFILLGLLFGYFIRTYLEWLIQRNSARLKAIELLKRISKEQSRRPDKKFQEETKTIYDDLLEKVNMQKAMEINSSIMAAETSLNGQIEDFNKRQAKVQTDLDNSGNFISQWILPKIFEVTITTATQRLKTAFEENKRGNVSGAEDNLITTLADLDKSSKETAAGFGRQVIDDSITLESSDLKSDIINTKIAELKILAKKLLSGQGTRETLFKDVDDTNYKIIEFINLLSADIRQILSKTLSIFRNSGFVLPDSISQQAFYKFTGELLNKIKTEGATAEFLHELPNELNLFYTFLRNAIVTQANITSPDQTVESQNIVERKAISEDIKNGKYTEAAEKAVSFLNRNGQAQIANVVSHSLIDEMNSFAAGPVVLINKVSSIHTHLSPIPIGDDQIDVLYKRTYRGFLAAQAWQTIFAGIIITGLGYFLYAASFTGTSDDFVKAFLWAFTLDVSAATMLSQIQAWKAKQP